MRAVRPVRWPEPALHRASQCGKLVAMTLRKIVLMATLLLALAALACAADVSGKWTATFDTPIGTMTYTYTFKVDGEKLTGTAKSQFGEVQIAEGSVKGDDVAFVENFNFEGQAIRIEYKGKVAGDEIKFTRKVGDFGTEDLVAKRAK